jgi:2-polyprenyl-3-methyl-5-hydroxy-6-metoxy-1,4-benzoquinol methylase
MEKKNYSYPDTNDKITSALIKKEEPYAGYWEKSEKQILSIIKRAIQKRLKKTNNSWLLDAGCGRGRLLPEFKPYFDKILAVDPDVQQIEKAADLAKHQGFANKAVFENVPIEEIDWKKESMDVILCSHVLQHVHTENVARILNKFNWLAKKGGLLFIMTTHSGRKRDHFAKDYFRGAEVVEEKIEKDEFNSLVTNKLDELPVHFFSIDSLTQMLENCGFTVLNFSCYHVLRTGTSSDKAIEKDQAANKSKYLNDKVGRDMLVTCKKQISKGR